MKKWTKDGATVLVSALLGLIAVTSLSRCGSDVVAGLDYQQIERLGRPAINEGLVTENALLNAYNSVAPNIDLTSAASSVIASAAKTLTAFFAGVCFVNGAVLGATTSTGLHPAGVECAAVGAAVFDGGGQLTAATTTAAGTYITKVAEGFLPDVMRIDTSRASGYFTTYTCNDGAKGAMLCGGRKLDDNVIDITYGYLLAGDPTAATTQLTNGTTYTISGAATAGGNTRQGHHALGGTFPYAAAPN